MSSGFSPREHTARYGVLSRSDSFSYRSSLCPCIAWCSRPRRAATLTERPLAAMVVLTSPSAPVNRLELLEAPPGADGHAGERRFGEVDGHLGLVAEPLIEPCEKSATAGEHDAAIHDVRSELGRRLVQRRLDRLDDLSDRIVER